MSCLLCVTFSVYKKDLEKELKGETSGDFAKLVVALLQVILIFITFNLVTRAVSINTVGNIWSSYNN